MFYRPRRRPSDMKITLRQGARKEYVKIVDVSETGLKITLPLPLAVGDAVTLDSSRLQLHGTVKWVEKGHAGVHLDQKLSAGQQSELSGASWGF